MTAITFDGVTLKNPAPYDDGPEGIANATILENGKVSVQYSTEPIYAFAFECATDTLSDITSLTAKIGTKASLIIDGTTYTNCVIKGKINRIQDPPGWWIYVVKFVRHTA